jgi:hypothetical protein
MMIRSMALLPVLALSSRAAEPSARPLITEIQAVSIAIKAWEPTYGKEIIFKYRPYRAYLEMGVWHVHSIAARQNGQKPGGRPAATIQASDGRVIKVFLAP